MKIIVIGTLDTKGVEVGFVKDEIIRLGHTPVVIAGCARDLEDATKANKPIIYFHYEEGAGAVRDLRLSRGGV